MCWFNSKSNSHHKHNHCTSLTVYGIIYILAWLAVLFCLVGLAYRLFVASSIQFPPFSDFDAEFLKERKLPPLVGGKPPSKFLVDGIVNATKRTSRIDSEKCDISDGEWVRHPTGPFYTNETCPWIEDHQNCLTNGRPDTGHLFWRWKPRDCELPKFYPERFLDAMRNKSLAFIGDSISRNHGQSLLCILCQVEQAIEVYHTPDYLRRKWLFPSYHFTLLVIWSPFLAKSSTDKKNRDFPISIYLDTPSPSWAEQYTDFDYIVIAGGKWFLNPSIYYENNTAIGCHFCPESNLKELGFDYAYRRALQLAFNFITSSKHKVRALFRTITPNHFEKGGWNSGGYCRRTAPFKNDEIDLDNVDRILHTIDLEEFQKAAAIASSKGMKLELFDATYLSLLRPDGHPGIYKFPQPFSARQRRGVRYEGQPIDCLHWCLPGPIDFWNDFVMELLL